MKRIPILFALLGVLCSHSSAAEKPASKLLLLIDGETGGFQLPAEPHDGVTLKSSKGPASFTVSAIHPHYAGAYGLCNQLDRNKLAPGVATKTKGVIASVLHSNFAKFERDTEYWLGFAVYFPPDAASTVAANAWSILYWHPNVGTLTAIRLDLGPDFRFKVTPQAFKGPSSGWFGSGEKGKWNEIVINVILSTDKDKGRFRVWHKTRDAAAFSEGFAYHGITMNPALEGAFPPFLKFGLMHIGAWQDAEPVRTIYFDEIRLAQGADAMDLVKPGSGSAP